MDTMRRLVCALLGLGLVGLAVGCCHHAAVCDCAGNGDTCCYGHGPGSPIDTYGLYHSSPVTGAPVAGPVQGQPEVIQVVPQNGGRMEKIIPYAEPPVLGR
jgi:hypothetical protein